MDQWLEHYGTPRHSGRYPWGSGDNPYQSESWYRGVQEMRDSGMTDKEIYELMGMTSTEFRQRVSVSKDALRAQNAIRAQELKDHGYSNVKIGEMMGLNESVVRSLLKPGATERTNQTFKTAEVLKEAVKERKFIDVGSGSEAYLGVSATKLNTAVKLLKDEGYQVYNLQVNQLGTGFKTTIRVLAPPGTEYMDLVANRDKISPVFGKYTEDGGSSWVEIKPPVSIDPKRVGIRYAEEGGIDMDGVIQVRRGVEDISLGDARYAQVRIKVGEDRYLKGMAMYSDDMPEGVDLLFNTNKEKKVPFDEVLKKTKDDPDNPFGATIRQRTYIGADGKEHLSAMNIVNEEGDWMTWKKSLSSQLLSKQPIPLAKKQLDQAYSEMKSEFDEICSLTNPAVKKKLLESFSEDCDSDAVHLKAAGLPRQASKVILPFPDMNENEVYAPGYRDGESVVLVRYPHGGIFEIPTLTVNNKQKTAKSLIENAKDAIGINPKVAQRLSGADFDGDTVLVIPNSSGPGSKIKTSEPLKGLIGFDPQIAYRAYDGMPRVSDKTGFHKQNEMGKISNLITDMTIKGATQDEIARAVRHSMVVIDAEKHNLNWRQSFIDNDIASLKEKYQGSKNAGASTLISKSKSTAVIPQRKMWTFRDIDPETGEKIFKETGETYEKNGKLVRRTQKSTKMAETKDAYSISSGTAIEDIYADYANKMKALANQARKEYLATPAQKYSPSAKKVYSKEVEELNSQLLVALKNSPLERKAQLAANLEVSAKKRASPDMDKDEFKRLKGQALTRARARVGAKKTRIKITPRQWEAIQAGAVSNNLLTRILANTDLDDVKALATPRSSGSLSKTQLARAAALLDSGATQADVADRFGVSVSTLNRLLSES